MRDMGLGGFFMHSRTGLVTEYLGDEWFRLTNACAEEAQRLGTENPAFRTKFMGLHVIPGAEFAWREGLTAAELGRTCPSKTIGTTQCWHSP